MQFNEAYDPIRALQSSWALLKQAPLPLLVGGGILVITGGGDGGSSGSNFGNSWSEEEGFDLDKVAPLFLGVLGLVCCLGLFTFLISSWVRIGFANTVEEVLRTGRGEIGGVFDGRGRLGDMLLARLLCIAISIAAILPYGMVILGAVLISKGFERYQEIAAGLLVVAFLLWLPVILYVVLGVSLADQAVALEGRKPVDSVRRSWSLVQGHRWMLLWYMLASAIFSTLGLCLCCIGIFLTGAMAEIAKSESFLALTRGDERSSWWIQTGRAPPTSDPGWGSSSARPGESGTQAPQDWGTPPIPPPAAT
jgi:hypothetical protein